MKIHAITIPLATIAMFFFSSLQFVALAKTPLNKNTQSLVGSYTIVGTNQTSFYDNHREIKKQSSGDTFYGQDANFPSTPPSYTDNQDGTITDTVTGLMWQKGFEVLSYSEALKYASTSTLGGYNDWRLPTIKELYSLIMFDGIDPSSREMYTVPPNAKPFINTDYFDFQYGANGERIIDTQYLSQSIYTGTTMGNQRSLFGLNIADGRIKGYPIYNQREKKEKNFSVRLVRGNSLYGINNFQDNKDGTISDLATGLMWSQSDSKTAINWEKALAWVQQKNKENYLGYSDWRLPDAKELHSIVDYNSSPQKNNFAAIDPIFSISIIKNEDNKRDYPFFWSSTTHLSTARNNTATAAVYFAFGEASGFMKFPNRNTTQFLDVHGAGAQRSDPKSGDPETFPTGRGPQGDVVRINNYVRLVRN